MQRLRLLAVAVIAATLLALAGLAGPTSPPAGADPTYFNLQGATYSPRYSSNGCLYRVIYLNYGSIPVANVRLYGSSCTSVGIGVAGAVGTTITWTQSFANPAPYGVDGCGAYSLLQVVASQPGVSVGAWVAASGAWHLFRYDGTRTPRPPVVPC